MTECGAVINSTVYFIISKYIMAPSATGDSGYNDFFDLTTVLQNEKKFELQLFRLTLENKKSIVVGPVQHPESPHSAAAISRILPHIW